MRIGEKAARLRKAHGLTLQQVSEHTQISISHLSAIETGARKSPSFQYIERLAHLYGVPMSYFSDSPEAPDSTVHIPLDADTEAFIAQESSGPYLALARKLAEHQALDEGPDTLLRLIADFLKEHKGPYSSR